MESAAAILALSSLAHERRLSAFRLLVKAGAEGLAAGELAQRLKIPANTLSTNLAILSRSGLVTSRRLGRSVIYVADYGGMSGLISFLMDDCCEGRPEICAPVLRRASSADFGASADLASPL